MEQCVSGWGIALLVFLSGIAIIMPAIPAAGIDHNPWYQAGSNNPEIGPINPTEINGTALESYRNPPGPVTLFHAEVRETSLPGPRYMAFGPSFVDITINPMVFGALVVLISLGIARGCIRAIGRWGKGPKE